MVTQEPSIPEVFKYLFHTYGNITDQMIHEERATLLQHQYIHDEPVANIFSKIHKCTTLAEAHGTPETDPQFISIGKPIHSNAHIFTDAIEKWNDKPDTDKTWNNFKKHFTAAQINYKVLAPPIPHQLLRYLVYGVRVLVTMLVLRLFWRSFTV